MKKIFKKLLLVAICLNITIGILQARETNPKPSPNTTKYLEYKTAAHSTCSKIEFETFYVDKTSNVYATKSKYIDKAGGGFISIKEVYRISPLGTCRKFSTLKEPTSHGYIK